jgi:hypothetical protein
LSPCDTEGIIRASSLGEFNGGQHHQKGVDVKVSIVSVAACLMVLGLASCSDRHGPAQSTVAQAPLPDEPTAAGMFSPPPDQPEVPVVEDVADKAAYQTMEAGYLLQPGAQWGVSSRSGSSVGDEPADTVGYGQANGPELATDQHEAQGVDWLEVGYGRSVQATEVRVVMNGRAAVGGITRVDLIDDAGQPHTVWAGSSDVSTETRGEHTWFVRQFDKTPYKVNAVKLSFGNAVFPGAKRVDAVQLVGR